MWSFCNQQITVILNVCVEKYLFPFDAYLFTVLAVSFDKQKPLILIYPINQVPSFYTVGIYCILFKQLFSYPKITKTCLWYFQEFVYHSHLDIQLTQN